MNDKPKNATPQLQIEWKEWKVLKKVSDDGVIHVVRINRRDTFRPQYSVEILQAIDDKGKMSKFFPVRYFAKDGTVEMQKSISVSLVADLLVEAQEIILQCAQERENEILEAKIEKEERGIGTLGKMFDGHGGKDLP